jgi:hypothetical protein
MTTVDIRPDSFVKDFERMKHMAEIKVLSQVSLQRPLSDKEYNRMMELKQLLGIET